MVYVSNFLLLSLLPFLYFSLLFPFSFSLFLSPFSSSWMSLFLSTFFVKLLSCDWLFLTPWTAACQAPLSVEFLRQEYWSGLPFPSPNWIVEQLNSTHTTSDSKGYLLLLHSPLQMPVENPCYHLCFWPTLDPAIDQRFQGPSPWVQLIC